MPSNSFEKALCENIEGEVRFDSSTQIIYSVDASIFEIRPLGVVIPKSREDIIQTVKIASKHKVPIIPRGAATGITGGCLGRGLILDTSKYLNTILEIGETYAICEPGVIQDQLNAALAEKGCRLGPETSTGDRATLGGMLANNAAGGQSLRFGKMVDAVEECEVVLSSGEVITLSPSCEHPLIQDLKKLVENNRLEIENRIPKIPRMASGYLLDQLLHTPFNPAKILCGSEGTLGIVTKIKVKIHKIPKVIGQTLLFFDNMEKAFEGVIPILEHNPLSLEMMDEKILKLGKRSPMMRGKHDWLIYDAKALFVAEFDGETEEEVTEKLQNFEAAMKKKGIGFPHLSLINPKKQAEVKAFRKAGLGLLMSKRTYSQAIAFIEDLSIPPKNLAPFMEEFIAYLKDKGKEAGIYGHVGSGCMHIRPYMDLRSQEELTLLKTMMQEIASLVLRYGGALSGEHGDGKLRSWLQQKMFGEKLTKAFSKLKTLFDPENLLNPVPTAFPEKDLRISPKKPIRDFETFLNFEKEGGLALSADMCNGNGRCRKPDSLMCPSFQATRDEYDTTRARAQTLRSLIHTPGKELSDPEFHNVLKLCIGCKGCKTECPSQVDMTKIKEEALFHYQNKHGAKLRDRLFANPGATSYLPKPPGFILNWLGVTTKRPLPKTAKQRFSKWFKKNIKQINTSKKVVLFNDTFTEFYSPEIGIAAVQVLSSLGFEIISPKWQCCGRPALSKGFLKQAKELASHLIKTLYPFAKKGIPIVGLEPSCLLTIKDDFPDLLKDPSIVETVTNQCFTFDEFLLEQLDHEFNLPLTFKEMPQQKALLHGHCHQKALVGMAPTLTLLKALPHLHVEEIPSGCCGMAGSFGYEKEHYELSMRIGELKLFPAIRKEEEAWIIANGTSCRSQIVHGTKRVALHLAEVISRLII